MENKPGASAVQPVLLGAPEAIASDVTQCDSLDYPPAGEADETGECPGRAWWQRDKADFLDVLCDDIRSLFNGKNALTLLVAGGVSFTFHETLDDDVADFTAKHPNRWGKIQDTIGGIGNPLHQLAAASGIYAYGLMRENVEAHELGKTLFNATSIATVSTTLLKFAANTQRPNGDPRGWPSGHTASSVAFASVLDDYYGHCIGIPAYALAGLVAWERIDDREHDLSDVVFGAMLGYVIGHAVASEHLARFCGMQFEPYVDPATGASGVALEYRY